MRVIRKPYSGFSTAGWLIAVLVAMRPSVASSEQGPPIVVPISPDGVQRATIILDSYSYSPSHLVVESGQPVELTLSSITTLTPHNFIVHEPSNGLAIEQDVGAGKTAMVRFVPTQPSRVGFYCDKRLWPMPSHREKGMQGVLEVR
ncbi:MAG TPA: cupredoxin domain-containing protein [Nitrospira sp.]|nr:cupredoxin domain-containing protein [Nitrospira sp.]